jgi:hypothetical protein
VFFCFVLRKNITAKFLQEAGCDLWHAAAEKKCFLFHFFCQNEDAAFVQKRSYFTFVVLHLIACGIGSTLLRKLQTKNCHKSRL